MNRFSISDATENLWTVIIDINNDDVTVHSRNKVMSLRDRHKELSRESMNICETLKPVNGVVTVTRDIVNETRKIWSEMSEIRSQLAELIER